MTHPEGTARSERTRREERGTVVVGVDGTTGSAGALRYAVEQAGRRGCGLHLVHVGPGHVPVTPLLPYLQQSVAQAGLDILRAAVGMGSARGSGELLRKGFEHGWAVPRPAPRRDLAGSASRLG